MWCDPVEYRPKLCFDLDFVPYLSHKIYKVDQLTVQLVPYLSYCTFSQWSRLTASRCLKMVSATCHSCLRMVTLTMSRNSCWVSDASSDFDFLLLLLLPPSSREREEEEEMRGVSIFSSSPSSSLRGLNLITRFLTLSIAISSVYHFIPIKLLESSSDSKTNL